MLDWLYKSVAPIRNFQKDRNAYKKEWEKIVQLILEYHEEQDANLKEQIYQHNWPIVQRIVSHIIVQDGIDFSARGNSG